MTAVSMRPVFLILLFPALRNFFLHFLLVQIFPTPPCFDHCVACIQRVVLTDLLAFFFSRSTESDVRSQRVANGYDDVNQL